MRVFATSNYIPNMIRFDVRKDAVNLNAFVLLCYRPSEDWVLVLRCGFTNAILNAVFNKIAKYINM